MITFGRDSCVEYASQYARRPILKLYYHCEKYSHTRTCNTFFVYALVLSCPALPCNNINITPKRVAIWRRLALAEDRSTFLCAPTTVGATLAPPRGRCGRHLWRQHPVWLTSGGRSQCMSGLVGLYPVPLAPPMELLEYS